MSDQTAACKGSWLLGTACGKCSKCHDEAPGIINELIRGENERDQEIQMLRVQIGELELPIPMRLNCPKCGELHIDEGDFEKRPHHTHACQHCGMVWRPAVPHTVGVRFLPGFKNA